MKDKLQVPTLTEHNFQGKALNDDVNTNGRAISRGNEG